MALNGGSIKTLHQIILTISVSLRAKDPRELQQNRRTLWCQFVSELNCHTTMVTIWNIYIYIYGSNKSSDIKFGNAFIRYAQYQNIGKPNNLKVSEVNKPKCRNRRAKIGYGHLCLREENFRLWSPMSEGGEL
jgi:nitric oxide synthase oxygenase domain/subunit